MKFNDLEGYKNYLRMSKENFLEILSLTAPLIAKQATNIRDTIPADLKLAVTVCYLSTGATFTDLYVFRVISLIHNLC